jgi:hypothetical protein
MVRGRTHLSNHFRHVQHLFHDPKGGYMTKRFVLAIAITLMTVSLASADNPCIGTNWAQYIALNTAGPGGTAVGCTIGNLDFSNFSFTAGGTIQEPASNVGVSIITTPGNQGFTFNPGIILATPPDAANTTEDVELDFTITALPGTVIDDLGISFNGTVSGTGQTSFSETETGATWAGCGNPTTCTFAVTNPPVNLGPLEEVFLTPVTTLRITKDIGSSTGGGPGTAAISAVTNQFSNIPEPRLVSFLAISLLAGLAVSRKRLKSRSARTS